MKYPSRVIKKSIATPALPLKPCLPWLFLLSIKLTGHAEGLRKFLDSLPKPFHWRVETKEEAEGVHDGIDNLNQKGKVSSTTLAKNSKDDGNKAFAAKDREAALKAYTNALSHIRDIFAQRPDVEEEKAAKKLMAICLSNRAATYLIPGTGCDASKALQDGKAAEEVDPGYNKA